MKSELVYVVKREEFNGKVCDIFYLNDAMNKALDINHPTYKDNLIKAYEDILFYTQITGVRFIDRRREYEENAR